MDNMDDFLAARPPTALRPLLGQTVLVVEDSRFACEAVRLVCLRSGARVRRANSLANARRHLRVHRPSVALIDLGLPDGSGVELIAELAEACPRVPVLLGASGDDTLETEACAAGADGFLTKPIASVAVFQNAILAHLPREHQPPGPRAVSNDEVEPDHVAFHDDLAHAREALRRGETAYVAQFIDGIAHCVGDEALMEQARRLSWAPEAPAEHRKMDDLLLARLGSRLAV